MEIQMQLEGKIMLFTSSRSTPKRLSHYHLVRPPGGVAAKQSSALSFWFVDKYQSSSPPVAIDPGDSCLQAFDKLLPRLQVLRQSLKKAFFQQVPRVLNGIEILRDAWVIHEGEAHLRKGIQGGRRAQAALVILHQVRTVTTPVVERFAKNALS